MRFECPSFAFGTDVARGSVSFGPNQGMVRKPNIIILLNITNTTFVILSLDLIAMYFSMFDSVVGVKKFLNFKLFSVGLKKSKTSCSWTAVSDFVFVLCTLCGLISSSDRFHSLHCLINDSQFWNRFRIVNRYLHKLWNDSQFIKVTIHNSEPNHNLYKLKTVGNIW